MVLFRSYVDAFFSPACVAREAARLENLMNEVAPLVVPTLLVTFRIRRSAFMLLIL